MGDVVNTDTERVHGLLTAIATGFGVADARITVDVDAEDGLRGAVEGDGADGLVGRNGEVIDAIQYIASQVVGRGEGGRRRVSIDAGGYRARREKMLTELAERAANEAVEFGEEIELDVMTPHDRRIVHMALKERTDVVTRSEGDEPRRRIVVEPAD